MPSRINERSLIQSLDLRLNKMLQQPKIVDFEEIISGDIIKIRFKPNKHMSIGDQFLLVKCISINKDAINLSCFRDNHLDNLLNKFLIDVAGHLTEERERSLRYRWFDSKEKDNFLFFKSYISKVEILGFLDCFGDVIHGGKSVRYYERNWENKKNKIELDI